MIKIKVDGQVDSKYIPDNQLIVIGSKWMQGITESKNLNTNQNFLFSGVWYTAKKIQKINDIKFLDK